MGAFLEEYLVLLLFLILLLLSLILQLMLTQGTYTIYSSLLPTHLSLLSGSMMAMVFLPWLAALIFSMSSLGRVSLRLRDDRILVVAWPSLPGLTAAMILLSCLWPPEAWLWEGPPLWA